MAARVTVGLTSDWYYVTDLVVYLPSGKVREMGTQPVWSCVWLIMCEVVQTDTA